MEQVQYNLLFRWFIGLSMDDAVWVPTAFTKNRERLSIQRGSNPVVAAPRRRMSVPRSPEYPGLAAW